MAREGSSETSNRLDSGVRGSFIGSCSDCGPSPRNMSRRRARVNLTHERVKSTRSVALERAPKLMGGLQPAVHPHPAREGIEPAGAGGFLLVHAESVSALFVEVELDRPFCRPPAVDQ